MENNAASKPEKEEQPSVNIGNSSNPGITESEPSGTHQLLGKKAEKYLREAGNIEDMPDAQDEQEMDEEIEKEKE